MTMKKQFKVVGARVLLQALRKLGFEPRRRVAAPMLGLFGAAAVGAVTGMFLAPRPGRETFASVRKQLRSWRK
jgi:hypothetical protein